MSARVAVYQNAACGRHDTGWNHPEHQGRLRAVSSGLERALPELHPRAEGVEGPRIDPGTLRTVHDRGHVERVREAVREAKRAGEPLPFTPDTVVSAGSWDAALAAAGCAVAAVEAIHEDRYRSAFCATRPPGHHATTGRAMGFCLFNGVALAARHAVREGLFERVLIVDWDVHHGNGTQEIFWEDPSVFYLSMHQSPHYPGTGARTERGGGAGEGTTLNVPLPPGLERERYREELLGAVDRAAGDFAPELVLVSCGFDAARGDPLGGFTLEPEDYRDLTVELARRTAASAAGRLVSVLEGGYAVERLGALAAAHVGGLVEALDALDAGGGGPGGRIGRRESRESRESRSGGASP